MEKDIFAVVTAIIGLAVIALLIKNSGGTSQVIGSVTGGLGNLISVADTGGVGSGPISMSSNYSPYSSMTPVGVY